MFQLLLKPLAKAKQLATRRSKSTGNLLDLGNGEKPCTQCIYRERISWDAWDHSHQILSSGCSRFVDCVTGAPTPCRVARSDRGSCGADGRGYIAAELPSDSLASDDPALASDLMQKHIPGRRNMPLSPIVDVALGGAVCRACTHCDLAPLHGTIETGHDRCSRWIDATTGTPVWCVHARNDSSVCGSEGTGWQARTSEQITDDYLRIGRDSNCS